MRVLRVDPRKIKVPETRVTAQFDPETYEQFKASMEKTGIIPPPIVYQVGDELVLCDGLHRIQEEIAKGTKAIDVAVFEGDMAEVLTKNIFLDHLRGKHSPIDMIKVMRVLAEEHNMDSDQIRERTGLTRDYIERLLKISTASPEVLYALEQGAIGVGIAFELSRLPFYEQQEEVLAKSTVYRLQVKTVKDLVDSTLAYLNEPSQEQVVPVPGEPPPPRKYYCEGCRQEIDPRYTRLVNVCPECLGALFRMGKARETAPAQVEENGGGG